MNCQDIQNALLEDMRDAKVTEHLKECAECRFFEESLRKFIAARPDLERFTPPEELDYAVLNEARLFVEKQMKVFSGRTGTPRKLMARLPSYFAAAACGVLIAWLIVLALQVGVHTGSKRVSDSGNISQAAELSSASSSSLSWDSVSIDDELSDVSTDIDINYFVLTSQFPDDTSGARASASEMGP